MVIKVLEGDVLQAIEAHLKHKIPGYYYRLVNSWALSIHESLEYEISTEPFPLTEAMPVVIPPPLPSTTDDDIPL